MATKGRGSAGEVRSVKPFPQHRKPTDIFFQAEAQALDSAASDQAIQSNKNDHPKDDVPPSQSSDTKEGIGRGQASTTSRELSPFIEDLEAVEIGRNRSPVPLVSSQQTSERWGESPEPPEPESPSRRRPTREAVKNREPMANDMKYHPADRELRPKSAKRAEDRCLSRRAGTS